MTLRHHLALGLERHTRERGQGGERSGVQNGRARRGGEHASALEGYAASGFCCGRARALARRNNRADGTSSRHSAAGFADARATTESSNDATASSG